MSILCACIGILSAMCVAGAMSWWRNPQEEEEEGGREEKQEEGQEEEERLNINKSPDSKDVTKCSVAKQIANDLSAHAQKRQTPGKAQYASR